ncbi:Hypothetical protein SCF082_LOCUS41551 [Durusdinium trenchii]|uniref:Hexosyltransferase n=2 Tax=Durusdinium trenchii TaxID=1381693 RepID=A0ABP0QLC7_9DINO
MIGFLPLKKLTPKLLLSDHPVSFQDVKSMSIGAFNSKRAPWNSWYNVPVFLRAWKQVVDEDQRFQQYDWTVKVDADTFFCHDRLRQRLVNTNSSEAYIWLNYDAFRQQATGGLSLFSNNWCFVAGWPSIFFAFTDLAMPRLVSHATTREPCHVQLQRCAPPFLGPANGATLLRWPFVLSPSAAHVPL